jgi:tripeptidyl-peptidase-2
VKYILAEPFKSKSSGSNNSASGKSKKTETFEESLTEHRTNWLGKMDPDCAESKTLFEALKADANANQLQVHMAMLNSLEVDKKHEKMTADRAAEVLEICNYVLGQIKPEEILAHFATKNDPRPDAAEVKKEMERQRTWLLEALVRKGLALCRLDRIENATDVLQELMKFTGDPAADKGTQAFYCAHAEKLGHYGRALKCTLAHIESKPGVLETEQRAVRLLELLGWTEIHDLATKAINLRYPEAYELF